MIWASSWHRSVLLAGIAGVAALSIGSCAARQPIVPPPAPEAIPVYIPIPKPCEVEKVAKSRLVTEELGAGDDLYEAVKRVLADRSILKADREKLVAANDAPCPPLPTKP